MSFYDQGTSYHEKNLFDRGMMGKLSSGIPDNVRFSHTFTRFDCSFIGVRRGWLHSLSRIIFFLHSRILPQYLRSHRFFLLFLSVDFSVIFMSSPSSSGLSTHYTTEHGSLLILALLSDFNLNFALIVIYFKCASRSLSCTNFRSWPKRGPRVLQYAMSRPDNLGLDATGKTIGNDFGRLSSFHGFLLRPTESPQYNRMNRRYFAMVESPRTARFQYEKPCQWALPPEAVHFFRSCPLRLGNWDSRFIDLFGGRLTTWSLPPHTLTNVSISKQKK